MSETPDLSLTAADGYRVLARKYRPSAFDSLIGQDALVRTLTNGFAIGRIAQAYMLTGVRGVGKTTTARLIARALNYTGTDSPSIEMADLGAHCEAILESRHVDVLEMDAASKTGIDDVREIIESVRYKPISARYKVYIIDEVHMLSRQAFNALLKTLEEPPEHVKFIFATTEIRKVPVTVLSRCQRFDLRRLEAGELIDHLKWVCESEAVDAEEEALRLIVRGAEGSVRDALSLLDQAIAYSGGDVRADGVRTMMGLTDSARTIDLFEALMRGDAAGALNELSAQHDLGADPVMVLSDLAAFTHLVTRIKVTGGADGDGLLSEAERTRGKAFSDTLTVPALTRVWQMLIKGLEECAASANALKAAEMILIRLAYAASLPSVGDLARLVEEGEPPAGMARPPSTPPGGPTVMAVTRSSEQPRPDTVRSESAAPMPETPELKSFTDIVSFVGAKRDLMLKRQLEHNIRPVKVAPGQIEIALEAGAPRGLAGELSRKLEAWTKRRWMVLISQDEGEDPIARQRGERRDSLYREAREHPDVRAILAAFPGAEIIDVTDNRTTDFVETGQSDAIDLGD